MECHGGVSAELPSRVFCAAVVFETLHKSIFAMVLCPY